MDQQRNTKRSKNSSNSTSRTAHTLELKNKNRNGSTSLHSNEITLSINNYENAQLLQDKPLEVYEKELRSNSDNACHLQTINQELRAMGMHSKKMKSDVSKVLKCISNEKSAFGSSIRREQMPGFCEFSSTPDSLAREPFVKDGRDIGTSSDINRRVVVSPLERSLLEGTLCADASGLIEMRKACKKAGLKLPSTTKHNLRGHSGKQGFLSMSNTSSAKNSARGKPLSVRDSSKIPSARSAISTKNDRAVSQSQVLFRKLSDQPEHYSIMAVPYNGITTHQSPYRASAMKPKNTRLGKAPAEPGKKTRSVSKTKRTKESTACPQTLSVTISPANTTRANCRPLQVEASSSIKVQLNHVFNRVATVLSQYQQEEHRMLQMNRDLLKLLDEKLLEQQYTR